MKRFLIVFCVAFLVIHIAKLLVDSGHFRELNNHGFGGCKVRAEVAGAEDLEYSNTLKRIFISSDNRPEKAGEETPAGAIWALTPSGEYSAEMVSPNLPFPFHPHGIALWEEAGNVRLFAINHRPEESTIEVFDWLDGKLVHVRTFSHEVLITPNDLVATGAEDFYLSHDHGSRSHFAQTIENFLRIGRGYLTRYDGTSFFTVDNWISFANGLAIDKKNKLLYVAAMLEKSIRVYSLADETKPKFLRNINLSAAPDNIKLSSDGTLWVAAHPKLLLLKSHSQKHSFASPSMVIRIKKPESDSPVAEEVMVDDGTILPAASIALPLGRKIYLGSIYSSRVLECDLPTSD